MEKLYVTRTYKKSCSKLTLTLPPQKSSWSLTMFAWREERTIGKWRKRLIVKLPKRKVIWKNVKAIVESICFQLSARWWWSKGFEAELSLNSTSKLGLRETQKLLNALFTLRNIIEQSALYVHFMKIEKKHLIPRGQPVLIMQSFYVQSKMHLHHQPTDQNQAT